MNSQTPNIQAADPVVIETAIPPAQMGNQRSCQSTIGTTMDTKSVQLDDINVLQILNEEGVADMTKAPKLSSDQLRRLYVGMVLTRKFDARMLAMQRQGEMGTFAPNLGQEATQIGQVFPLTADDWFAPSYRSFGAQIWRGWSMEQLLLLWAGYHEGFPPPDGVNDLPFSIVIGSHVLPAVGVAMGMAHKKQSNCVTVNFGDGAISQGAVNEAFNFAAVYKAPCVFICENNGWAISTPIQRQAATESLAVRGVGFGIPSIRVDGNDILAMVAATTTATQRARAGQGPSLIEAVTYRMSLHTTADDPKVYREDKHVDPWHQRCPLLRFERFLNRESIITEDECKRIHEECEQRVLDARARFREVAKARPEEIFDFVYHTMPPELIEQKKDYLSRLARKGLNL